LYFRLFESERPAKWLTRHSDLSPLTIDNAEQTRGCGGSRVYAELDVHVLKVFSHSVRGDPEDSGDLSVRLPVGNPGENLALARSEAEVVPSTHNADSLPEAIKMRRRAMPHKQVESEAQFVD
jgi:hypothetical protein